MARTYTVIRDTREQKGWDFPALDRCLGTVDQQLPTGDYSIVGCENDFVIERKGTCVEFAGNLSEKRFWDEITRLQEMPYSMIICEFDYSTLWAYPFKESIPPAIMRKIKVRGPYLTKRLNELILDARIPVVFAGKKGRQFAESVFKRMAERAATG